MRYTALIILVSLISFVNAQKITQVDVRIDVHEDRSITVSEYYEFYPGGSIKHGLFRHIPIKYYEGASSAYATPFEIISVKLDDVESEYHTRHALFKDDSDFKTMTSDRRALWQKIIYMGSKNTVLSGEKHTIELKYHVGNVIKELDGQEVLGWNLLGYGWKFTRKNVNVIINLNELSPENITMFKSILLHKGEDFSVEDERKIKSYTEDTVKHTISYSTALSPNEDLTIYLYFNKGTFAPPMNWLSRMWAYYKISFILFLGLLLANIIWFIEWRKHGVNPSVKSIHALYSAPDNMSPMECRYFRFRTCDRRSTTAYLVDCAIKRYISFSKEDEQGNLRIKKKRYAEAPHADQNNLKILLDKDELLIERTQEVSNKFKRLDKKIEDRTTYKYPNQFFKNLLLFFAGLLPMMAALIVAAFTKEFFPFIILITIPVFGFVIHKLIETYHHQFANYSVYLLGFIVLALVAFALFVIPYFLYMSIYHTILAILCGASAGLWRYLLENQTELSTEKEMKIRAFEHYLKSTEERFLDFVNKPDEAPALFDRNLPYAIALNCELKWVEAFEKSVKEANIIHDLDWGQDMNLYFISHYLASHVESDSVYSAPSSSGSGFFGGGFDGGSGGGFGGGGGGFGGGGGGGW